MKKQNKIKNTLLRIKWENIIFMLFVIIGIIAMIKHKQTNIALIIAEAFIYLGMPLALRYIIKDMRKEALYEAK